MSNRKLMASLALVACAALPPAFAATAAVDPAQVEGIASGAAGLVKSGAEKGSERAMPTVTVTGPRIKSEPLVFVAIEPMPPVAPEMADLLELEPEDFRFDL